MKSTVTVDDILSWRPHKDYSEEYIRKLCPSRNEVNILELLEFRIPEHNRLWIAARTDFLSETELRLFLCDTAASVLETYESRFEGDKRPRQAIEAARSFAAEAITAEELGLFNEAVRVAAEGNDHPVAWAAAGCSAPSIERGMVEVVTDQCVKAGDAPRDQVLRLASALRDHGHKKAVNSRKIEIRLAQNTDGESMGALAERCGFAFGDWDIDWSDIYPYWILAEVDGEIIGMLNVCPGKPFGRLEMMCVEPTIGQAERRQTIVDLDQQGRAVLVQYGCQGSMCNISFGDKGFKRFAKKHGYRVISSGNLLLKRLR